MPDIVGYPSSTIGHMQDQAKAIQDNIEGIKKKVAVLSGKGGVGKTFVAVNLAALLAENNRVGLLDADIDCPNINLFLGITERLGVTAERRLLPVEKYGVKAASMGSVQMQAAEAIIWRGPMITAAIYQLLEKVEWGELDWLIIDMPPGTSDAALTIMQSAGLHGVIIVSTPQKAAVTDARKAISMCSRMGVPVLGVVENMSGDVFGSGNVEAMCQEAGVKFLGKVSLTQEARKASEDGIPAVKESKQARKEIAEIVSRLA